MVLALVLATLLAAAAFAFFNGMTDAPHAFGPAVRTGALTPRIAVAYTAALTALGAVVATGIAVKFITELTFPSGRDGLLIILSGALAAAAWGFTAHRCRVPTSSTHALAAGVLGSSLAAQMTGHPAAGINGEFLTTVFVLPMLLSPWLAYGLAFAAARAIMRWGREESAHHVNRRSRIGQSLVSSVFALAHGIQDGQRTAFLFLAVFFCAGVSPSTGLLWAVTCASAFLLGLGAALGSWRIARTLTHRMTRLEPVSASIGSGTAAFILLVAGMGFHVPLSSAQLSTAGLLGAAEANAFKPTQWVTVARIAAFWIATPVAAALAGAFGYLALRPLV